ncbi:MAG: isoprenylcysteine carboxylmethyltransferase family protein [Anaerolineales bacterium]|jgi:protein-S-isoprenylcysteine O-methyltransferase Ste14
MTEIKSQHALIPPEERRRLLSQTVIMVVGFNLIVGLAFFLSAGDVNWPQVWIMLAMWALYFLTMYFVGLRISPDMVLERAKGIQREGKSYERPIISAYLLTFAALAITAGLDHGRYGWSHVPLWVEVIAFIPLLFVYILPIWATFSNPFAAGVMRIQEERGHHVISTGPYRFIRHPMYLSTVLFGLFSPLFVGSWWALIPGFAMVCVFIVRTILEDRTLTNELPGYAEYTHKVRYRILPGIW